MHLLSFVPALAPSHRRRAIISTVLSSPLPTVDPFSSQAITSSPSPSPSPSPAPSASASPTPSPTLSSSDTSSSDTQTSSTLDLTSAPPTSYSSLPTVLTSPAASSASALAQPSSSTPLPFTAAAATDSSSASPTVVLYTVTTATPSSTATHSSSSGFFSNTAAVAGTFTVVGLVGIAAILALSLLLLKRRQSTYEEDTEFLDKATVVSTDPARTHAASLDHGSPSDGGHYGAPMALSAPPVAAYYPEHAYALHPQGFQAENPSGSRGYPAVYPRYPQEYAPQRAYSPNDHNVVYPHIASNMSNPHELAAGQLNSTPAPQLQSSLPNALRPSVSHPTERARARYSVDSFYTGIARDASPPPGQAI